MKIIFLLIGLIALIFVGISQYDKIKKKTLKNETTSFSRNKQYNIAYKSISRLVLFQF